MALYVDCQQIEILTGRILRERVTRELARKQLVWRMANVDYPEISISSSNMI